jgi:putative peptidoglycan lipid II flippase
MQRRSVARAAAIVGSAYILSNLAGFLARLIINARFGTGAEQDAFRAAFIIPDLLFNLLAGGALASAFIPTYVARLSNDQQAHAWRLAKTVALIVFFGLGAMAFIAGVFAEPLIAGVVARQFSAEQVALTASLMRIMLISTVIFGVSGLLMGVLQSNDSFLAPALAPTLYQLGMILGATLLAGLGVYGLAWGVVFGALMHLLVQLPALWRSAKRDWRLATGDSRGNLQSPISNLHSPLYNLKSDVSQILRMMPPRVLGLSAVQVNALVTVSLASGIAGGVSAINNAFAIMILPLAVIAQAIGTALFPAISAHAAKGEHDEFARAFTQALAISIALSAPASAGLVVLGEPIIRILFERGQFDAQSTQWVAFALAMYGIGLIGHAMLELVTRAFYALKDSVRPAIFAVGSMVLNIALSLLLAPAFASMGLLSFGGLALANSIATALEAVVLYALLLRREPRIDPRVVAITFFKSALAAGVMAGVLFAWLRLAGDGLLATLAAMVIGAAVYFGLSLVIRNNAVQPAFALVARRLRR